MVLSLLTLFSSSTEYLYWTNTIQNLDLQQLVEKKKKNCTWLAFSQGDPHHQSITLNSLSQVITPSFLVYDILVNFPRCYVVISVKLDVQESFVVAQIQVNFSSVIQNKHLACNEKLRLADKEIQILLARTCLQLSKISQIHILAFKNTHHVRMVKTSQRRCWCMGLFWLKSLWFRKLSGSCPCCLQWLPFQCHW